jgi:hypothetical protein
MKRLFALCGVLVLLGLSAVPALAAPAAPHLHKLTLESGKVVMVGPDGCGTTGDGSTAAGGGTYNGYVNFHDEVHNGAPPPNFGFVACPS